MKQKRSKKNLDDPRVLRAERARMSEMLQRLMRGREFKSEAEVREFLDSLRGRPLDEIEPPELSDADRAQDLVFDAWEERDSLRRVKLARQALELWPDCADAYGILAEAAGDPAEERRLLEAAVAAAERVLGPDVFKNEVGRFWGIYATRPYMRVRFSLAFQLWRTGEKEAAVRHVRALLRLNPDDNMGIRYKLLGWLLELDDRPGVVGLLHRREEDSAMWRYARALFEYRGQGDADPVRAALEQAFEANPYVPLYMCGVEKIDAGRLGGGYTTGSREEAAMVMLELYKAWYADPGAVRWLAERWEEWLHRNRPGANRTGAPQRPA